MMRRTFAAAFVIIALFAAPRLARAQELPWEPYLGWDVPYVPTPTEVVEAMLRLAEIKPDDLLYDLGCGDGRIVIAAARTYGIRAVGIDIDAVRIGESEANAAAAGVLDKVRFIEADLFEADFSNATVITMYLLNSVNLRLRPKLLSTLKPGTRLVSHRFTMDDWRPDKSAAVPQAGGEPRWVYSWVVPANVTGRWLWELATDGGARAYALAADQRFQDLRGKVSTDGGDLLLTGGRVEGAHVLFRYEEERDGRRSVWVYEGEVQGESIRGRVRRADEPEIRALAWNATRDPGTIIPLEKPSANPSR